jgi:formylglycine-generating enzyme required for sulfatase activity
MRTVILLLAASMLLPAQKGTKSIVPINIGRKVALVIGNSAYSRLDAIPAAANDADDMASTLRSLGFEVSVKKNLGVEALITEVIGFGGSIRAGDLALLYYSGHGGSVGEENYLLPVDYEPPSAKDLVDRRAYAMSKVRDVMEQSGALVRVLIFDACRGSAVTAKNGEADPRPIEGRPEGTLIAFASAHKQDALFDARQRNSLYTGRLLAALKSPDADFKGLLEGVQRQVYEDTRHQQTPYLYGFLSGPLYLASLNAGVASGSASRGDVTPVTPRLDAAAEAWALLRDSKTPEDFDDFARSFPNSDLATAARLRAAQLRRAAATGPQRQGSTADPTQGASPASPPASPAPDEDMQALFRRFFGTGSAPAGKTKVNAQDGLTYIWIPPGDFTMGCSPDDASCQENEKPARRVTVSKGFWMGQTPVTQEAFQRVTGKTPSHFAGARHPVEQVDWNEATNYCRATGMRLPTEVEWEYAARAGTTGIRYGDINRISWYTTNAGSTTHDVMTKEPNAWGLFDMLGNVWQWTADQSGNGSFRWLRGGSFVNDPDHVRVSMRYLFAPDYRYYNFGFRCAGD